MQKWEYRCIQIPTTKTFSEKIAGETVYSVPLVEKIVNELGEQGWELVMEWGYAVSGKNGPTLFFRRSKP